MISRACLSLVRQSKSVVLPKRSLHASLYTVGPPKNYSSVKVSKTKINLFSSILIDDSLFRKIFSFLPQCLLV